jgi:hypothetical protein
MARSENKTKTARVRRSLGPAFTSMICPTCGEPHLDGMIDVNGVPYAKCAFCSFRCLGMTLRSVAALKFMGQLLNSAPVREAWNKAILATLGEAIAPPQTVSTAAAATDLKGVGRGDAA